MDPDNLAKLFEIIRSLPAPSFPGEAKKIHLPNSFKTYQKEAAAAVAWAELFAGEITLVAKSFRGAGLLWTFEGVGLFRCSQD